MSKGYSEAHPKYGLRCHGFGRDSIGASKYGKGQQEREGPGFSRAESGFADAGL